MDDSARCSARRDPAWTADGFVSERWLPVSPVTGRLDAFEWKDPLSGFDGGVAMIESHKEQPPVALSAPRDTSVATPPPRAPGSVAPSAGDANSRRAEFFERAPQPASGERERTEPAASPRSPSPPEPRLRAVPTSTVVALAPRVEKVIPLVHVPDDPGPDHEATAEPAPEPASEPPSDSWSRIRHLFKP